MKKRLIVPVISFVILLTAFALIETSPAQEAPCCCGDYLLDPWEECDDGNIQNGDGCSSTCQEELLCENPLIIEFEKLRAGEVVSNQYLSYGIVIGAINNNISNPNKAIVFNSSNPSGGNFDLGSPNKIYGGPGIGAGGVSNNKPLNNILILAENDIDLNNDTLIDDPKSEPAGGSIYFYFTERKYFFNKLTLIDMDLNDSEVYIDDETNGIEFFFDVKESGDNSVQTIFLNSTQEYFVDLIRVTFSGAGGLDRLVLCPGCPDEDGDGVCDEDDLCPGSRPGEPVDDNGCDIFQFCGKFGCGWDCLKADWRNNEPEKEFPRDCTVGIKISNGLLQQPICIPNEFSSQCAG